MNTIDGWTRHLHAEHGVSRPGNLQELYAAMQRHRQLHLNDLNFIHKGSEPLTHVHTETVHGGKVRNCAPGPREVILP